MLLLKAREPQQVSGEAANEPQLASVVLPNDTSLDQIDDRLLSQPLIEITFPAFSDGRGLSLARYLRLNRSYDGVLRASGNLLPDQLSPVFQVGFDEIVVSDQRLASHGKANWLTAKARFDNAGYLEAGSGSTESIWQRRASLDED